MLADVKLAWHHVLQTRAGEGSGSKGEGVGNKKKKSNLLSVWKESAREKLPAPLVEGAIQTSYTELFIDFNWKVAE